MLVGRNWEKDPSISRSSTQLSLTKSCLWDLCRFRVEELRLSLSFKTQIGTLRKSQLFS